jgi:hypothetical protein
MHNNNGMKRTLAACYLWWKPPEEALLNPPEILRQILGMEYAIMAMADAKRRKTHLLEGSKPDGQGDAGSVHGRGGLGRILIA